MSADEHEDHLDSDSGADVIPIQSASRRKRPLHKYVPALIAPAVHAGVAALDRAGETFVSGDALVQICHATRSDEERQRWTDADGCERFGVRTGTPRIALVSSPVLKMQLSEALTYLKYVRTRGQWEPCAPPEDVVNAIHTLKSWGLPGLAGIGETPILRADYTIAEDSGYDPKTRYWISLSETFPRVKSAPTQTEARAAFAQLAEVFQDFAFAEPGQACVPIAAILTMLARPCLADASVPGFAFDAPTGGEGKTLVTDTIATIATGRPASRTAYPHSDEEAGKVLGAYALRGASLISIDDVKRPLGGENLDRILTARGEVDFRMLGKTEVVRRAWLAILLFTGNNITYLGQMARRVCSARLQSGEERPQDRSGWTHDPLLPWVKAHRPELVAAALTIVRAYIVADRPDMRLGTWGSMEEWAALIPPAIVYAGGANVLEHRPKDVDDTADSEALRAVLVEIRRLCAMHNTVTSGMTAGEIHAQAGTDLKAALRALAECPSDLSAVQIGVRLGAVRGRPITVEGRKLSVEKVPDPHRATASRWRVKDGSP